MSEADYGVSYIASAPEELKIGDRVEVVDAHEDLYQGRGEIIDMDINGVFAVRIDGLDNRLGQTVFPFKSNQLRKLPDTISFEKKQDEPWNVAMFRKITAEMADTYARKNATYNDSFGKSVEKYGFIAALTRMSDKFNRIENLILGAENKVPDESLEDSLLDLACYSVMTIVALRGAKTPDSDFENVD